MPGSVDNEVVEGDHIDVGGALGQKLAQRLADEVRTLVEREERRLARVDADRHDDFARHVQRLNKYVEMPVRHRIERAGVECRRHRTCFRLVKPFVMDGDGSQELCRRAKPVPWETAAPKK
ncbi:hypothetical protein D3C87_1582280 [compost metagenome]